MGDSEVTGQLLQEGATYLVWLKDESRAVMARAYLEGAPRSFAITRENAHVKEAK